MSLALPESVARYLALEADDDADSLQTVFAVDAEVHDEGRIFRGLAAINAWKVASRRRYRYTVDPLAIVRQHGDALDLKVRVAGDFPGSPVVLDYAIVLAEGRIVRLEIH